jgi:hypothetical protein
VFRVILGIDSDYFSKQHKQIGLRMETRFVLFEVGTQFLNIFWMSFDFKGLTDFNET